MIKNKVTYVIGNILDATQNIVVQQVNCQGAMGSGLAGQLIKKYPKLRASYIRYCSLVDRPEELLGQVFFYYAPDGKIIANIYGQLYFGRDGKQYTSYDALAEGFITVGRLASRRKFSVAVPYGIGCGLGGGEWSIVKGIIESWETTKNDFTTVYKLDE